MTYSAGELRSEVITIAGSDNDASPIWYRPAPEAG